MYIDIFIVVLLVWAGFNGWKSGFLKELVSTGGIVLGLIVAGLLYAWLGDDFLAVTGSSTNMVLSIIAFFILWIVMPIALGMIANILTKAMKGMQVGVPNSVLGLVFSLVKYVVLLSCVLNVMQGLGILDENRTTSSHLFKPVCAILPFDQGQTDEESDKNEKPDTVWVPIRHDVKK